MGALYNSLYLFVVITKKKEKNEDICQTNKNINDPLLSTEHKLTLNKHEFSLVIIIIVVIIIIISSLSSSSSESIFNFFWNDGTQSLETEQSTFFYEMSIPAVKSERKWLVRC